jgi:hypothetical protein
MRSDHLKTYHETETVNMQSMENKPLLKTTMVINPSEMKYSFFPFTSSRKWNVQVHENESIQLQLKLKTYKARRIMRTDGKKQKMWNCLKRALKFTKYINYYKE